RGEPTAGIYGFANILLRLLEVDKPEYLAVAFDTGKTFRNELFPQYKATRAKMPDDLRPQIERIRQMVDDFDLLRLEKEGAEADDVLGTIAHKAVAEGLGVKIITGDKDLLQLVSDRITVSLPGGKTTDAREYRASDVKELLGVTPEQVVDYKALVGDHSDNIPGVPGVGEKTAVSLLSQYQTLDEIYKHLDELSPRVKTKLEEGKESAYLSQDLAQIRTNIEVGLDLEKANTKVLNLAAVEELFRELEFRSLIPRLHNLRTVHGEGEQMALFAAEARHIGVDATHKMNVHVVDDAEKLADLRKALDNAEVIALDTETTSTNAMQADLVGISLAVREGEGYYIPIGHVTGEKQLPLPIIIEHLSPALQDPKKAKVGHNLKFDIIALEKAGLSVSPLSFDTMIAEWVLRPESHNLGLKDMAE
ncbi:DNA polymerase I, partial [bacterium]|nr:DNA polymerase I [bacterium]